MEIAPEQARLGAESSQEEKAEGGQALRLDRWWESFQSRGQGTSPKHKKFRNCSRGRRLHLRETLHRLETEDGEMKLEYCYFCRTEEKVLIMKTGYGSDPISFRDPVPFSPTTVGRRGQRAISSFQSFQTPLPCWAHPSPSFQSFSGSI